MAVLSLADEQLLDMQLVSHDLWLELHPDLDTPSVGDLIETSRYGRWRVVQAPGLTGPHGGIQVTVESAGDQGTAAP